MVPSARLNDTIAVLRQQDTLPLIVNSKIALDLSNRKSEIHNIKYL